MATSTRTVSTRTTVTRTTALLAVALTGMVCFGVTSSAVPAAGTTSRWTPIHVSTSRGKPVPKDTTFSIAVLPDTQQEVLNPTADQRFAERSRWLVANKAALNLKFVTHTGDVVNWDTPDHAQYQAAQDALSPLETAKIPYSLSVGNHDTQAVGVGGGCTDCAHTATRVRDTGVFNQYFTAARYGAVRGAYELGKVDNVYSTFTAGGDRWLVLNLELWPRSTVVDWAKTVVATHPDFNVVVATHSYLNSDATIYSGTGGYGATSPQYLFDNLVKVYPNIKLTFSGHTGTAISRVDTGIHGNKIVSYLQAFHSNTTNPIRLVEVNTKAQTVSTRIYAPHDNSTYPQYVRRDTAMNWVTPAR